MHELSVFCDESGDFGPAATHAPCCIVCLLLHEQDRPLEEPVARLVRAMQDQGFEGFSPVHTAPLIRREGNYSTLDGTARKKMFDILFSFFRKCPVSCKAFAIDKRWHGTGAALGSRLAHELDAFLRDGGAGRFAKTYLKVFNRKSFSGK